MSTKPLPGAGRAGCTPPLAFFFNPQPVVVLRGGKTCKSAPGPGCPLGITPSSRRRGSWHGRCQPQMWQLQVPKEEPSPPAPGWAHPARPRCSSSLPAAPAGWCGGVRIWPGADNPLAESAWGVQGRLCRPGTPAGRLARDFCEQRIASEQPKGQHSSLEPPAPPAHRHRALCGDPTLSLIHI